MEMKPEAKNREQIARVVFDGLKFIWRWGATNRPDRPMVHALAEEWGFPETADWIEREDYGRDDALPLRRWQFTKSDLERSANGSTSTGPAL